MSEATADPGTGPAARFEPDPVTDDGRQSWGGVVSPGVRSPGGAPWLPHRDPVPVPARTSKVVEPRGDAHQRRPYRARPVLLPALDFGVLLVVVVAAGSTGWWGACFACGVLVMLAAEGQHRVRICLRVSDQVPRIATAVALPLAVLLPWLPAQRVVYLGLCSVGALAVARSATFLLLRTVYRRGHCLEPTLVVGTGELAAEVARVLGEHPELGSRPRGFLDHGPAPHGSVLPLLGGPSQLASVIDREAITRVLVCPAEAHDEELTSVLRACRRLPIDVCVVPRLHELGMAVPRSVLDEAWGIPLIPLRRHGHIGAAILIKRAFDIVAGTAMAAVLAPLVLGASAVIRATSGGTAYFRQQRITLSGRARWMVKLRTASDEPGGVPCWTVGPGRCTPFGAWLRATHLDELPQLINVLRGDMSLVGPRPERPYYAVRFATEVPHYADRHRLPGGMTGWAQVHGLHGDTSIAERARFDNHYIEYWSLWMDLVIVARTPAAALGGTARFRTPTRGGTP